MSVNSARNPASVSRIHDVLAFLQEEENKKRPRWDYAVKRAFKEIEGLSARNVADAQVVFLATRFPERPVDKNLYEIAQKERETVAV